MKPISTGLHVIRKRLKSGERFYVYAWRGGPLIHQQDGSRPAITMELIQLALAERDAGRPKDGLDNIIDLYRASPDFTSKRPKTQEDYRSWLNRISARFGKVPASRVPELRAQILDWRDELADTPRAADRAVGMLHTLFRWALDRDLIEANPARDIRALHKANRSDLIWEERHWQAVADVPPHVLRVLRLASLTGLRQSDLLELTWEQVGKDDIETTTQKAGGRAVIPLYPELRAALGRKGKQTGVILRTTRGTAWTADGFKSSWRNAKPAGFERRFHDLRGTFITVLATKGFTDAEIAYFVGWTAERVAAIRMRYVDRARVSKALARRMK